MVFNVKYQIEILQKLNILFNVPWRIEDNFPKKGLTKENGIQKSYSSYKLRMTRQIRSDLGRLIDWISGRPASNQ